ncbi:MAG: acyl-CoA dehydrogenase family protein [Solirubrobacteraceae bacterium]
MNFSLTEEQEFLQEAARGALGRVKTVEAARDALEGAALPDLWPAACEAGWPGMLISEANEGAGLEPIDAMLVFVELGKVLASVPLLGHLPASYLLDRGSEMTSPPALLGELAAGARRAAFVGACPPSGIEDRWTVASLRGPIAADAPTVSGGGAVSGAAFWVPDAPGAASLVVVAMDGEGAPRAVLVDVAGGGVSVEPVTRYDATRTLGHVRLDSAPGTMLDVEPEVIAHAWHLESALLAAESLGAVEYALEVSVAYAKERFTFGRAIGSYQAMKHQLVEILRLLDNGRSLMMYAAWAGSDKPDEFALAASAFRAKAGKALEESARIQISVHGGIGATFEHDAPLYFRKAQLSRRLLGGTAGASDRVADELFKQATLEGAL